MAAQVIDSIEPGQHVSADGIMAGIVGPEEICSVFYDVFGGDFFYDGFVFIIVVGNRGAAQKGKEGSGALACDLFVGPFLACVEIFGEEIKCLFDAAAIWGFEAEQVDAEFVCHYRQSKEAVEVACTVTK